MRKRSVSIGYAANPGEVQFPNTPLRSVEVSTHCATTPPNPPDAVCAQIGVCSWLSTPSHAAKKRFTAREDPQVGVQFGTLTFQTHLIRSKLSSTLKNHLDDIQSASSLQALHFINAPDHLAHQAKVRASCSTCLEKSTLPGEGDRGGIGASLRCEIDLNSVEWSGSGSTGDVRDTSSGELS